MQAGVATKRVTGDVTVRAPRYRVEMLAAGGETRWNEFVHKSRTGTFFHLAEWRHIIEDHLGHPTYYLYCERAGRVVAILPLAQVRSLLFGNALISLPFLVYGGPVSEDDSATELLLDRVCELALELTVDHLELRNRRALPPLGRRVRDWLALTAPRRAAGPVPSFRPSPRFHPP